jgi:hypothetical protein
MFVELVSWLLRQHEEAIPKLEIAWDSGEGDIGGSRGGTRGS